MRKQIAAANWKMNLQFKEGEKLLTDILEAEITLKNNHEVVFAVPFPYLEMSQQKVKGKGNFHIAAQNCHHKKAGAFTGEVSAAMLSSMNIDYCVLGHSERREYNLETNSMLAEKLDLVFENNIIPIFCCGEPLSIRESHKQNEFVATQLEESLFHLPANRFKKLIIAYEPIWAIGTGKTATTEQAQEMHRYIRSVLAAQFSEETAAGIPILYGGSVKASNAKELFGCADVDGGLVGGASLVAAEFIEIIRALK